MSKDRYAHYKEGRDYEGQGTDDLVPILQLSIDSLKKHVRPPKYTSDKEGLRLLQERSVEYFQYIIEMNSRPDIEQRLVPDIESLTVYLGITRQTLLTYQNTRGEEWQYAIEQIKNMIASAKKQLALTGKIPPILAVFDLTNNHGYMNTSEFKISPPTEKVLPHKTVEQIAQEMGVEIIEQDADREIVLPVADF